MAPRFCAVCREYLAPGTDDFVSICLDCWKDTEKRERWAADPETRPDAVEAMEWFLDIAHSLSQVLIRTRGEHSRRWREREDQR